MESSLKQEGKEIGFVLNERHGFDSSRLMLYYIPMELPSALFMARSSNDLCPTLCMLQMQKTKIVGSNIRSFIRRRIVHASRSRVVPIQRISSI